MTTTFFLVRHAAHDNVGGFLAGRTAGIHLGEGGRLQAQRLGERMRGERFDAVYSSPRERTQETAEAIRAACAIGDVITADELDEIDFGSWSNRGFDDLDVDAEWRRWNAARSLARTPAGETMLDVQVRCVGLIRQLCDRHKDGRVVLVSHADVIKVLVCFYLGLPLDSWPRFEISPASITVVAIDDWQARLLRLNETLAVDA